jgi:selenide,water dikinase
VLGKPLGVGIYGAAEKRGELPPACYRAMIDSTTRLNTPGIALAPIGDVHALTDVTGFGLIGHLLEMCRAGDVSASIAFDLLPLLPQVRALAAAGFVTGASKRNWDGYGNDVRASGSIGDVERAIATDPQTSGGLLVACAPSAVDAVLEVFRREGFGDAAPIGKFEAGAPGVTLA